MLAASLFVVVFAAGSGLALGDTPDPIVLDGPPTDTNAAALLLSGQAAIDSIGVDMVTVAATNQVSPTALIGEFQNDSSLFTDSNNHVLYMDQGGVAPVGGDNQPAAASASDLGFQPTHSEVFSLQSNADAPITLYLDFDGHTTSGTYWNQWSGVDEIISPPYSLDADYANFSDAELTNMYIAWLAVAEDFAPFDVNVSTVEPPAADLLRNSGASGRYGIRTVITDDPFTCSCGGLAYLNRFGYEEPAFVFNKSTQSTGETISHEVGHSLGLTHDGTSDSDYYAGHGGGSNPDSWAPIMGASFFTGYSQWDAGTYADSNNSGASGNMGRGADDLALIVSASNGIAYRSDDHGASQVQATALTGSDEVGGSGVIERTNDADWFSFALEADDTVDIDATVDNVRPNLNAALTLHDASGSLLHSSTYETRDAAIHGVSLSSGTYFVRVTSEGSEHYDTYATLGAYELVVASASSSLTTFLIPTTTIAPTTTTTTTTTTIAPTPPPTVLCAGREATIVGTGRADRIVGTDGDDVIATLGGNDIIDARGGNDVICAGRGTDRVVAGDGDDKIYGGAGRDRIDAGAGNDIIQGGRGADRLFGDDGNDRISGMGGRDEIHGDAGADALRGGGGKDTLHGAAGDDSIVGGSGGDTVFGGAGADLLKGNGGPDDMFGEAGNDRMFGGPGNDDMDGGTGIDAGTGDSGTDTGTNFESRQNFA
jgi:Ca2+-binding RTX toxin-like protein